MAVAISEYALLRAVGPTATMWLHTARLWPELEMIEVEHAVLDGLMVAAVYCPLTVLLEYISIYLYFLSSIPQPT